MEKKRLGPRVAEGGRGDLKAGETADIRSIQK